MRLVSNGLLVAALAVAGCMSGLDDGTDQQPSGVGTTVQGEQALDKVSEINGANGNARPIRGNGITYHGGPVMVSTSGTNIHLIWYRSWSSTDQGILRNLVTGLSGSPYFNINTTYYNGSNVHVTNQLNLSGETTVNGSSTALSDTDIRNVVASTNPTDTNGIYVLLTSADTTATSGFCTQYCGWHTHGSINGLDIKYAFIGNPARCPSACTNGTAPPNGSVGADGAASIVAHEIEEAVTDPDLNAWFDSRGQENADKCAWTFGTTYNNGTGVANMNLGGKDYLIQRNWVNASGGFCATSF